MAIIPKINCGYCIAPQPVLSRADAKMVLIKEPSMITNEAYTKYWLGIPVLRLIGSAANIIRKATNNISKGTFALVLASIFSSLVTFGRLDIQKNIATAMNKPASM